MNRTLAYTLALATLIVPTATAHHIDTWTCLPGEGAVCDAGQTIDEPACPPDGTLPVCPVASLADEWAEDTYSQVDELYAEHASPFVRWVACNMTHGYCPSLYWLVWCAETQSKECDEEVEP